MCDRREKEREREREKREREKRERDRGRERREIKRISHFHLKRGNKPICLPSRQNHVSKVPKVVTVKPEDEE